jgi:hypothetical protein
VEATKLRSPIGQSKWRDVLFGEFRIEISVDPMLGL